MKNIKEFYRTKYKGSLFVVKAGGRVITDETYRRALLEDIKDLTDSGINILLIYGGGHAIDDALAAAGIQTKKVEGRRITTPESIAVIQKVMAGDLGFRISSTMAAIGLHGLALSNIPPGWGQIAFRERENPDYYGYDGVIKAVFEDQIKRIFEAISFIACPCTGVSEKSAVNINADNVAVALAEGVHARKLIFLTDVDGVLDAEGKTITLLTDKDIPDLIASGVAEGGMQVKLENCLHALEKGVRRIHLINGFKPHALAQEIYDSIGPGTMILREVDKESYLNEIETQKVIEKESGMSSDEAKAIIKESFEILVHTYNPQPVVLDRGDGVYAWDTDGKKYLDCAAGIAVASLGHANPVILETLNRQAARLMACQASYATREKLEAARILVENGCFDMAYFSNSGTESVEAAIKTARKWAYETKGPHCNEIIAFRKAFHGRTYGAASVTYKRDIQPYFGPYIEGVHFATYNDLSSVQTLISEKTAAIIVEPLQGEGGVVPGLKSFLKGLRDLCDRHKICLIFDEVQAGMGRIGTFYAYQTFGVEPDVACLAKGIGGGFPVGAMVAKKEFGEAITVGSHGTTYGGNPLACAVAAAVMKEILKPGLLENVNKMSELFIGGLKDIQRRSNKITDVRGMGLLIGIDTTIDVKKMLLGMQANGLMATQAGDATTRFAPPLIINEAQVSEALEKIEKTLNENE